MAFLERGTMTSLLDIQPRELKFTFESKKQSSCAIQLINTSDHYVAFKVKTTSPKKYCVRPNTGVVKPKSKCDFTVTMQAQRSAPSDLQCRDKFLVQSTVVPLGTSEDDITSGMFAKDNGKHIEESKLRVVLISPPQSPVLLQSNGVTKQELPYETSGQKDKLWTGVENLPPPMDVDDVKSAPAMEEPRLLKDVVDFSPSNGAEPRPVKDMEGTAIKLGKDIEELKSKLDVLESKLSEAGFTIKRLTEERSTDIQEKKTLKKELVSCLLNSFSFFPINIGIAKMPMQYHRVNWREAMLFLFLCLLRLLWEDHLVTEKSILPSLAQSNETIFKICICA
ncbi:vesicle-associated protein 2-2-like isoform X2 [Rhododendron vialii]|uniref:vesicle-associated protein 2-2-like isoform X2 n=1 Tax=Rhododendron vialii TaxID=182163 RepID=UPI00265F6231|nr:vesicle-associated protein 2-2-like isoform X2 [Rhododendron vialii]